MKRTEMIEIIDKILFEHELPLLQGISKEILGSLEAAGMAPPTLPGDYCQAIMHVYYGGYSFHQWEEEVEKDEKVMAALKRRSKK